MFRSCCISLFLMALCLALFSGCIFGLDRRGGVLQYDAGRVLTARGTFFVPKMAKPWKSPRILLKQLVHENDAIGATIVTDALCGPKFDDAPLPLLAEEMFHRLDNRRFGPSLKKTVAGHEGLEIRGQGTLDGVPVKMAVVVMKRDLCLYDFSYFTAPDKFGKGWKDFEDYLDGIKIH